MKYNLVVEILSSGTELGVSLDFETETQYETANIFKGRESIHSQPKIAFKTLKEYTDFTNFEGLAEDSPYRTIPLDF